MSWSIVPILGSRRRRDWKFMGFTVNRRYPLYVNKGDGIVLNDDRQPVTFYRGTLKSAKKKNNIYWKLVKDKREDLE